MGLAGILLFLALAADGPGQKGQTGPPLPPVIFNEVHYHPARDADAEEEFLELHNRTGSEVDLQGWEIRGGVRFRFDRGVGPTSIPAGGYLVVARRPAGLSRVTGLPDVSIAGPYTGRLSNFRERLILVDGAGKEVESFEYSQDGAWPARADGLGSSLQRISSEAPASLPQNWTVGLGESSPRREERVLLENGARVRWFENPSGEDPHFSGDRPWYHPGFDDEQNGFRDGRLAIGFDVSNRGQQKWINTDATPARGLHSILVRIPFEVSRDLEGEDFPALYVDWDDGFVAWLNGVEIARRGMKVAPGTPPPFNGAYLADAIKAGGDESELPSYKRVWTGERGSLRPGRNVLAIGNYNASAASTDLFLTARLTVGGGGREADFSPGSPNSAASSVVPPLVTLLERVPRQPTSKDPVVLRARVDGMAMERVEVHYSHGSGEKSLPLLDDGRPPDLAAGDGLYACALPPAPDLTVVRFRIEARSGRGPPGVFPREGNPSSHAGYYVVDRPPRENEDLQVFHLLWRGDLKCGRGVWRTNSIFVEGGTAHLEVSFKNRGETSCSRPKPGMKVRFNKGDLYAGRKKLNLLGLWEDRSMLREKLAWDLLRDIGHPHCRAQPAAVYTWEGRFQGVYVALDEPGEGYLRLNGLNPSDGLWKCRSTFKSSGEFGGLKKVSAPDDDEDERDLADFAAKIHAFRGRDHLDFLLQNVDVEAMIEYQAVKCLISDEDGYAKNWFLFHGTKSDSRGRVLHRWTAHPWDLDLSFGQNSLGDDQVFTDKPPLMGTVDNARHGTGWNGLIEAVFGRRSEDYFIKALYGRIWALLEEKFNPEVLGEKIDRLEANTGDEARADLQRWPRWGAAPRDLDYHRQRIRSYIEARHEFLRSFLLSEHRTVGTDPGDPPPGRQSGQRRRPVAAVLRRFRYTPAPHLKITEVDYHPRGEEDFEFIEIRNLEKKAVDLSGWNIPAVDYVFPDGSEAPAESLFIVARRPERLAERHGKLPVPVFGPYPGRLSNEGEDLRLRDGGRYEDKVYFPETIDAVKYRSAPPWPQAAAGGGPSLELKSPSLDNDYPTSWRASPEPDGTPGRPPAPAR
jgi:spore coat protein CotH